jgi:UDP-glucose 4-epimerase
MEVLVTGGAGFIGSHLCDLLVNQGYRVTAIDNLSTGRLSNLSSKVNFIQADISKKETWEKLNRFDALFHLAAKTSVTESVKMPLFYFEQNVISSKYISEWGLSKKVQNIIYANTAGALYGDTLEEGHSENALPSPKSPYGATKYACELFLMSLPLNFTSLRLANVYGERQITKGEAGVIPIFIENIYNDKPCTIYGENKIRDYIHVSDVCQYFLNAFEKMQTSKNFKGFFNIGTGIKTKDSEVFKNVSENINKPSTVIYEKKRDGEIDSTYLNISKSQDVLNYTPKINFSLGCQRTVNYYVENEL